ncbi:TonB-dependent receptor plug domain-containing protein [Sphingobium yanoikuyae]|uniref:TonB-dependent receptor plug domain-containing protein n=1 Tax=Sphingobium yanoikuyae TaxID=13690 RepID=UPI0035C78A4C
MRHDISRSTFGVLRKLWLSTATLTALGIGSSALAQERPVPAPAPAPTDANAEGTIVVVGNRSRATTALESPVPIDVIDESQLATLGANSSLRDALGVLLPSFNSLTVSSSSWNSVARPAGLRGLGGSHVLVLVNGKRRHNSSLLNLSTGSVDQGANSVDIDLIPAAAIKRIEVLRDGAAAQYGSDAIAGVINIVLKDDDHGGTLTLNGGKRYSYRGNSDGRNIEAGGNIGFKVGPDGFVNIAASAKDNNHARRAIPATGAFYYPLANGQPDPRESRDKTVFTGGLPDLRALTILYNAELPLSPAATLYSSSTWSTRSAIIGQNFRRPNSTNAVLSIYPDGYAPNYTLDENDFQILAGIRGEAGGWSWDLSSTYGENRSKNGSTQSLNASLGDASPTEFWTFTAKFAQWTNNLDISKGVDIGLAEPLKVSFGAEHRYERFQTTAGGPEAYANGLYQYSIGTPLAGRYATIGAQGAIVLTPDDAAKLTRNSYAAYVDLGVNPVPRWFIGLAGRAEHYDDSAGDTLNGKFTTRYDFTDNFAIRGTISNGFRAPSLAQSAFAQTSNQYTTVNGVQTFITAKSVRPGTPIGDALGAKPLTPEKSFNLSAGFTYRLGRRFNLSVDAYQIKLDDRIAQTGYLTGAGVSAILVANGFDPNYSVRYFANAIDTRTRGVEAVANYLQPLGEDKSIRFTLGYNYNKTKITRVADNPPELAALNLTLFDRQAQGYIAGNLPRSKLILGQDLKLGNLQLNLRETRYGSVAFLGTTAATDQFYGAKWIADIDLSFQATRNINVAIGANNFFDTYPDKNTLPDTNGFPPYPAQSPFGFYGGYYYGRLSFSF